MPKQNLNIKADLKKYKQQPVKVRGRPPTGPVRFVVNNGNLMPAAATQIAETVNDFIPGTKPKMPILSLPSREEEDPVWKAMEMKYRREEMNKTIAGEEDRMRAMAADPNQLISPFKRTIYLNCGHKVDSHINTIKLNSFYWCDTCILFRKISEIVY